MLTRTLLLLLAASLCAQPPKLKLWSLQPVVSPPIPPGLHQNPIDAFLAVPQKAKGLKPNPPADKLTLLRRATFDLTGLPPTPAEQDAFLADASPNAYDKLIDRLLASEQHGVRYARHWLDVLRYADLDGTDGGVMPASASIYRWRDWMIHSLNEDIPYDQFVRAQILGNRHGGRPTLTVFGTRAKAEPVPQDQFALGFLARAALTGNDRDQDIALNAVETVSSAFMGMTVACAKCHDHRFDPIKQTDFYAMKALFDPLVLRRVPLSTPAEIYAYGRAVEAYRRVKEPVDQAIEKLTAPYYEKLYAVRVSMLPPDVRAIVLKPERQRSVAEQKTADDYFPVLRIDPPKLKEIMPKDVIQAYDALLKQQRELKAPPGLDAHVIVEEDSARLLQPTYLLTSGDPTKPEKDKAVAPGFPFQPPDTDFRYGRREGFVDWLTDKQNPLFARVAVNRLWQWHFGEGLQKSPSDFGLLGGRPSHPQLLDFLAAEFTRQNFSMKAMHKLILTSHAYQQSSLPNPVNQKLDPTNTTLWRFRLQRLEAEPLWDAILSSAGQLDLSIGGKSFQIVKTDSKQSIFLPKDGTFEAHKNRRAAYLTRGYIPSTEVMAHFLQSFDVDDGRTPCPVRTQTITAPQALFSMNDPLVEDATTNLASRLAKAPDLPSSVQLAYRETIGRPPSNLELDRALSYLSSDPTKLKGLVWLLYNLDEFLFIR
ncbi:MAG: DUF1549 and DUF1553 domain-containing protein [Acidobacteria bacterium]|nr:DUF1549 and DUF1553 domain-containing protein [Acidobacteriota bacterium]